MLRWVGIENSFQILDAGSGSGAYLPMLCNLVGESGSVTALDLAPENIECCKERLRLLRPQCSVAVQEGSILQLPFRDADFHVVWCANTLQYLSEVELTTALSEFRRVTQRGGLVAIKDGDITCLQIAQIEPSLMWRFLDAARSSSRQIAGLMRAPHVPRWFRDVGFMEVRAKTYIIERRAPLKPVEHTAFQDILTFICEMALNSQVVESDKKRWRQVQGGIRKGGFLENQDFFIREGAIVVVGEVP